MNFKTWQPKSKREFYPTKMLWGKRLKVSLWHGFSIAFVATPGLPDFVVLILLIKAPKLVKLMDMITLFHIPIHSK